MNVTITTEPTELANALATMQDKDLVIDFIGTGNAAGNISFSTKKNRGTTLTAKQIDALYRISMISMKAKAND